MKVIKVFDSQEALVEYKGIEKKIDVSLVQPVCEGEFVLVHTGFAIQKIDEEEFQKTMEILEEESKIREELFPQDWDLDDPEPKFIKFPSS
ncbi:MAG: HypC/HybG/HupF family hydrogenase formation chaperone [Leptospiraceae bacterium]|nr:HypC/HybG/HupF family hydrogenase formation chaperone [Leptospiraceae bacterium]